MNSSKQDVVFSYISLLYAAHNDFIGIIPSSILAFLHFILVSIAEIIFHFHGSHEQFHIGHCVWNVSLVHQAGKYFIGLLPSSMSALLHFVLVFITFFIFMVVMNSSTKDIVFGIFPSSPRLVKVLEVLFPPPSRRFCISYWYTSQKLSFIFMAFMNSSTYGIVFGMFPSSPRLVQNLQVLFPPPPRLFFHFILVSIVVRIYFHGIQEQFHIGYCVWNASLLNPAREDFVGIIPFSIPISLHFILVSIAETVYFHGIHGQYHIGCFVWNVYLLQSARKVFIGIILFPILFFLDFILVSIFHFMVVMNSLIYNTLS